MGLLLTGKFLGVCRTEGIEREEAAERGQSSIVLLVHRGMIGQERGEIWTAEACVEPIHFQSDRLLEVEFKHKMRKLAIPLTFVGSRRRIRIISTGNLTAFPCVCSNCTQHAR